MSKSRSLLLKSTALLLTAVAALLQPAAADVRKRPKTTVPKPRPHLRAHEPSLVPRVPRKRQPVRRHKMDDSGEPNVPKPPDPKD